MTPKEKAQELYNKFFTLLPDHENIEYENQSAKKCAYLCTEEIIISQHSFGQNSEDYNYWYKVQSEIDLL
jgi:hypothetical protein